MNKTYTIIAGIVLVIGAILGFALKPQTFVAGSPGDLNHVGTTYQIDLNPSQSITSTTSYGAILNTSSRDCVIKSVDEYIPAIGVTNTLTVATSTASNGIPGTTIVSLTNSTTTNVTYLATSTPGITTGNPAYRVWGSGTYLQFNSTATDTAQVGGRLGVTCMP